MDAEKSQARIDKLVLEQTAIDEKIVALREKKTANAREIEDLELEKEADRIAGEGGISSALMDKLAQRVAPEGIESEEGVNGA